MHSTSSVEHGAGARSNQEVKSANLQLKHFILSITKRPFNSRILALHLSVCHSLNYRDTYLIYYIAIILSFKE